MSLDRRNYYKIGIELSWWIWAGQGGVSTRPVVSFMQRYKVDWSNYFNRFTWSVWRVNWKRLPHSQRRIVAGFIRGVNATTAPRSKDEWGMKTRRSHLFRADGTKILVGEGALARKIGSLHIMKFTKKPSVFHKECYPWRDFGMKLKGSGNVYFCWNRKIQFLD